MKNQRKIMEFAAKELNIKVMNDWYNVSLRVTIYIFKVTLLGIAQESR
jgi:hypothetical protein